MLIGEEVLEELIVGRVEPHIYAFSTNTIPNYLKIGDTYRPVNTRLKEWEKHFPELKKEFESSAKIDNVFFRDYAIHEFLENDLHKIRLLKDSKDFIDKNLYYSKEFFKDTKTDDIKIAINDIHEDYHAKTNKYSFYNLDTLQEEQLHYERGDSWPIRDNQQTAIDNFEVAINNKRDNLLMYAVMRFGKSFTALCCSKKIPNIKLIVVVSAKADVSNEWKKNVEQPGNFINFEFKTKQDLEDDEHLISNHVKNPNNKVLVLFLTLQELQGELIKDRHKELFADNTNIDLLIIDETHFGARADKYGTVLRQPAQAINKHDKDEIKDIEDYSDEIKKILKAKYKLHLSGTPYRILMGSEFKKDDIISFCQYSDIVDEQKKWDNENILEDVDVDNNPIKEWNNPYYGFPQMIRFAFNPNEASIKRLKQFKKDGNTYALSKLLEPKSTIKDAENNNHKRFIYEDEILELLEVIDGSKQDDEILSFINYDRIIHGNMCRHIVMVLPYCASCDAMENLIINNSDKFKNLKNYKIINISGIDKPNLYKDTEAVKKAIKDCEEANQKTITLTVNRMLTGSTVEQWDTMIFLKDTASPQEYDQAIFRLQSQYVKTYKDEKTGDTIKYNMKPQTLLVDFCIDRIFKMQELKAQIYNVNIDEAGNKKLETRLKKELEISPIIVINKNKIEQIKAKNILEAVSNYSKSRGVAEETNDIPVDLNLTKISEIWDTISKENELGSKSGFEIKAIEGEGDELDVPDGDDNGNDETDASSTDTNGESDGTSESDECNKKDPVKQFRMYYARILYYAFLTDDNITSLDDVISSIDSDNNNRIFKNMGLNNDVIIALRNNMNKFMLSSLDYKIQNLNKLSSESNLKPLERANIANQKFGRIGESEVVTPEKVTSEMINLLPDEFLNECVDSKIPILDIASKEGEFAIALYKRFMTLGYKLDDFKDLIYSIPTSNITYEFTRKIYEVLGLNINNIAEKFNSYDLLKIKNGNNIDYDKISRILIQDKRFNEINIQDGIQIGGDEIMMKFGAVVGNPPYQEESKVLSNNNGQNPRRNIFHLFQLLSEKISLNKTVLIYPGIRWMHQSGKGLKQFGLSQINNQKLEKLVFYPNAKDLFQDSGIPDGISIVYLNKDNEDSGFTYSYKENGIDTTIHCENPGDDLFIINPKDRTIAKKIKKFVSDNNLRYLNESILPRSLFGIESDFIEKNTNRVRSITNGDSLTSNEIKLLTNNKAGPSGRTKWFAIDRTLITQGVDYINEWQVVVSSAHAGGQEGRDNQIEVIDNSSAFGRARVALKSFGDKISANNFYKYCKSNFIRYAFLLSDESLSSLAKFVPDIGDYNKSSIINFSKDIDKQLYELLQLKPNEVSYIESMIKPME